VEGAGREARRPRRPAQRQRRPQRNRIPVRLVLAVSAMDAQIEHEERW
jgi:hypothetical protein